MLRTMKGTFSRFIAIAAIVALGVGLLSGLMAMPIDMRTTIDEYFDRQNMHDLRIVSPLGLTDDDVAAIAAVDGVDEVMPAYMTDMFVDAGEKKNIVTRIHSLPTGQIEEKEPENYLNRLDVVEGRLPIQRNECVLVEGNVIDGTGPLSVGNTLTIAATNGDVSGTLADTEFKIVGIVRTSYYFSVDRESATIGDGTVALKMYVGEESFSQEAYSEIFATVAGAQALEEDDYFRANCRRIIETRNYVSAELQKRGFTVTASQANFLFAKSDRIDGETLYRRLREKGVLIRHFTKERIKDYNRITIGSREEMEIFLQKTDEILEELT